MFVFAIKCKEPAKERKTGGNLTEKDYPKLASSILAEDSFISLTYLIIRSPYIPVVYSSG